MKQADIERKILAFWQQDNTFQKSVDKRAPRGDFVFYDGPPFATGTPHYGHIVASLIKDMVPRYFTMRGFRVERRWGWDCHGLPIENIVEKEHGFKHKKDILAFGVDKFNEEARSKVLMYVKEWREVIDRLGRWVDFDNDYKTMDPEFMESVWWVFKELYDKGLLYEAYRSMHICPRCETTLAQSEVAQGYKDVKDLSVVAKFELADEPGTFLLAWTTTPWTLPGNAALAVGKDIDYVLVKTKEAPGGGSFSGFGIPLMQGNDLTSYKQYSTDGKKVNNKNRFEDGPEGNRTPRGAMSGRPTTPVAGPEPQDRQGELYHEVLILAKNIFDKWKAENKIDGEIIKTIKGTDLLGLGYKPLFPYYESTFKVYAADFVNTKEGTGIVHIAPAFGTDDYELSKKENIPFIQHVNMDGTFKAEVIDFAGIGVKHQDAPDTDDHPEDKVESTDVKIVKYLAAKGLLFSKEKYTHSYPHCWRCDSPLLNYATSSWFVAVEKIKKDLLKNAEKIEWMPEHIKEGRFGQWLSGARDWSISRQRFWGSVLPIWFCDKDTKHKQVFGSIKDLEKVSGAKIQDLHKHFVDKITFKCAKCEGAMQRIPDVLDCWFESGSMPYGQTHYPFENEKKFKANFPAEFIAEGVDQTRAWFYYLHVLATALNKKPSFKHVIVNGIVLAEDGKKMSKRLQNYPDPLLMFDKYGADAVRYYLATAPVLRAEDFCFSEKGVDEVVKKVILILYNVLAFYQMYAVSPPAKGETKRGFSDGKTSPSPSLAGGEKSNNVLDKWILAKLNVLIKETTEAYDKYDLNRATRPVGEFVNELSTWYLRRSRDRFKGDDVEDKANALGTLKYVLESLSKIMAPVMPFTAEHVWQELGNKESIHLESWSKAGKVDEKIIDNMSLARKVVELGLAERAKAGLKIRQPLLGVSVGGGKLDKETEAIVCDELNVKAINYRNDEILSVVLDTEITPELKLEGHLRELVRTINGLRKNAGLTPGDVITLQYQTDSPELKKTFIIHGEELKKAVIASKISEGGEGKEMEINGEKISIKIEK